MKEKLFVFLVLGLFVVSSVYAASEQQQGLMANIEAETQNEGQDSQLEIQQQTHTQEQVQEQDGEEMGAQEQTQEKVQQQNKVQSGIYTSENGKQMQVQQQANNKFQLKSGEVSAETSMEMTQEQTSEGTKLKVKLSNGKNSEVKVMPDTASERAIERLSLKNCAAENGCSIELKEVGQGEQARVAYEIKAQKEAKVFGMFKAKMQVEAQVDAENGEVIRSNKPWWAFIATE